MSLIFQVLTVVSVLALIVWVVNPQAIKNLFQAGRAQVGRAGRVAKDADPLTMHQQNLEDAVKQVNSAKMSLGEVDGVLRGLNRQVAQYEKDRDELTKAIQQAVNAGDPNNTARGYALELQGVEQNLALAKASVDQNNKWREGFASQVRNGDATIKQAQQRAHQLGARLKMSEQAAKIAGFADSFDVNVDGNLATSEEAVNAKIDGYEAQANVRTEFSTEDAGRLKDKELARNKEADDILSRFKKKEPEAFSGVGFGGQ